MAGNGINQRQQLLKDMQSDIKLSESVALMTPQQRKEFFDKLSDEEITLLEYSWMFWAREKQRLPTVAFRIWLLQCGRGFGKTRTGAETIRLWKDLGYKRFALVGSTPADARDVMVMGESGLIAICPPWDKPEYQPTKRRVVWNDGTVANIYSGANPEQLRGPQHEKAWCDEIFAWQYPQETWDMLQFGLRLGKNPQSIVTSTPKPNALIKWMRQQPTTYVTHASTYENKNNLAPSFFSEIVSKYEGTRLGRQEIEAEILDDNPNALWSHSLIDRNRLVSIPTTLVRIVVAIDPAVSSGKNSNETGIIVAGLGKDKHGYILEDISLKGSPNDWGNAAIGAYYKYNADRIVAEVNNGGAMIESVLRSIDPNISYRALTATKGKLIRAEPVAALYEQGKVHHVGCFGALEDQMCDWVPGDVSPDRLDAAVWCITELMLGSSQPIPIIHGGSIEKVSKWR